MFAVLYIADFTLQAVLRREPGLGTRAAALFTDSTKKSLALAVNPAARTAGVELGMTAPQAVARCPALLIRTPNAAAEADARAALLAVGFTLSPAIEDTAAGVCTIDLKGSHRSHERAATAAIAQLERLGLIAAAGIGATPLLALYAARGVAAGVPACRVREAAGRISPHAPEIEQRIKDNPPYPQQLAEDGSPYPSAQSRDPARSRSSFSFSFSSEPSNRENDDENHRPPGKVLLVADAASFLAPLPLAAADPPAEIATVLASWGLRTLGELTALSRDDIGRRLGPEGLALWDRARGGAPRPLNPVAPPQTFSAARDFEDEIETLEPLLFTLRRFLERLSLELRTSGYVAAALDLTLMLADDSSYARSFRLPEPTADLDILFRALHTHLESLRTASPICGVQLGATPTRPLVRQQGLFDTGLRDPHGFAETLARIVAIVGSDRVGTPEREDTHRPDTLKLIPPTAIVPAPADPPIHPAMGLPLRRFRPPLRAQLELTEGKPTYVWTDRFNGAIAQVRGPWQSSGDWWQPDRAWRRTEYDIVLAHGGLYRLALTDGSWFVEGEYD